MISAIFLFSGINKIFNYDGTVGWMEGFGIPGFLLVPAIIVEILFPLMVIVGYQTRIAAGGLLLFSLLTAFIFHLDFSNQMQLIAFLKNIGNHIIFCNEIIFASNRISDFSNPTIYIAIFYLASFFQIDGAIPHLKIR